MLCIRRTLAEGRLTGLVSGLGAATADALYGLIAAFGLTFISDLLINQRALLGLFGGLFLLVLGVRTLLAKPGEEPTPPLTPPAERATKIARAARLDDCERAAVGTMACWLHIARRSR